MRTRSSRQPTFPTHYLEAGAVTLEVFNMQGQRVAVLATGTRNAGNHTFSFDAARFASDVYLYRLQSGSFSQV